jgi:hypothetical protein
MFATPLNTEKCVFLLFIFASVCPLMPKCLDGFYFCSIFKGVFIVLRSRKLRLTTVGDPPR